MTHKSDIGRTPCGSLRPCRKELADYADYISAHVVLAIDRPYSRRVRQRVGEVNDGQELPAMSHFGIPKQNRQQRLRDIAQVNWRRGLFRVWLLFSAAWMMGWIVYLIINGIKDGLQSSGNLLAIPVLLAGPPIALLLFGIVAGWALRGFTSE